MDPRFWSIHHFIYHIHTLPFPFSHMGSSVQKQKLDIGRICFWLARWIFHLGRLYFTSFKFLTRSLDKHCHNDPCVHLFVKCHEIQNSCSGSQKQIRPLFEATCESKHRSSLVWIKFIASFTEPKAQMPCESFVHIREQISLSNLDKIDVFPRCVI